MGPQNPQAGSVQSQPAAPRVGVPAQAQAHAQRIMEKTKMLRKFPKKVPKQKAVYALVVLLVVLAGIGTGWALSGSPKSSGESTRGAQTDVKEAGIADEATFRDSAEGMLREGGVDGEGTHHLVRNGSGKNVYLTSTVIDLQGFADKKVKVWGETISAQKAGWLMDVGKIKVVD